MSEASAEASLRIDILTIFPAYLEPLRHALLGKAMEQGIVRVGVHDLRQWATGGHKSVDARPFGGGPGMVMKPEVWGPALDDVAAHTGPAAHGDVASAIPHLNAPRHDELEGVTQRPYEVAGAEAGEDAELPLLLVPTPSGPRFTQEDARRWSRERHIVVACGRYEGIDERVFEDARRRYRVREVSLGDYVLVGGEAAALVIVETVTRLIPGVLGNQSSHLEDSFSDGLLEGPCYTKPREWRGLAVPEVLTSGDHAKVARWRREQSLARTARLRPDLLAAAPLEKRDEAFLEELVRQEEPARETVTDLHVFCSSALLDEFRGRLGEELAARGVTVRSVEVNECASACERTNILLDEAQSRAEAVPPSYLIYRLEVHAAGPLADKEVTRTLVAALPEGVTWYGSTRSAE